MGVAHEFKRKTPDKKDPPPNPASKGGGGRNDAVDFRHEKRSNSTHESTTDPQALLFTESLGATAKLCFWGHALIENREGGTRGWHKNI